MRVHSSRHWAATAPASFGIEASELGAPMHYIQSALGHGSVAVTERYYAKYDPNSAAKQLLRVMEGGGEEAEAKKGYQNGYLGGLMTSDCPVD